MNLTLFDLDGTLLPLDTNHAFGAHMVRRGWVDGPAWTARSEAFLDQHHRGELDLPSYIDFATSAWRDRAWPDSLAARASFVDEIILPAMPPSATALVERHRRAGDLVALVTGTNEFLAEPIAQAFGIEHLLAVRLERDAQGRVTGRIDGTPSFHAGKVERVEQWLAGQARRFADFDEVTFYGDSVNDIPLLEAVNRPVAANPSDALRALAVRRGWPVVRLFD